MHHPGDAGGDSRARDALEVDLFLDQRSLVGRIDSLGILAIATYVPISLYGDVALPFTLTWSVLVALTTIGWSSTVSGRWVPSTTASVWGSGLIWATLPWLAWTALDDPVTAWVLTAVCGYGLATDALLLPQTFRMRIYSLMSSYLISYLVALTLHHHWYQAAGLVLLAVHLGAGVWGLERIKNRLLNNQMQSEVKAFQDPLTGLGSRRAAIREIERLLADGSSVHCVIADVDDFKGINTHLGHHGGDAALVALGEALQRRLKSWFVGRLGGDEFIAINRRGLHPSEEGLLLTIDVGEVGSGLGPQILSLSLGGSSIGPTGTADELLSEASAALRRAKALGKQRLSLADDTLRDEESDRERIAGRAHQALREGEIVAWGQPIYDLTSHRPAGVELLARWPQPDGGMEMPADFVPIIEAQGLGSLLGERMIRYAITLLERLTEVGDSTSFVSVNLSALTLLEPELPANLSVMLQERGLAAERLVIEMTESQKLPSTRHARSAFARLRATGVGVASDDLGAGWSSINQMIETAFTHVKVDRGLTTTTDRPGAFELLQALRLLAESAGQIPIAEGIETRADLDRVLAAGFRYGQGYLLDRPTPLPAVIDRFRSAANQPLDLNHFSTEQALSDPIA
ncbi:MAG: bifunctional diguanylate cyclase/phosphodiesterase [Actinomycetota bacterium]